MTMKEYSDFVDSKLNPETNKTDYDKTINALLGLGEVGEILDIYKKSLYQGHEFVRLKVLDEAGDVLFYLTSLLRTLGFDLNDAIGYNVEKLNMRYKKAATNEESINRTI